MDSNSFNQACRYLQPEQMVCVRLITGQPIKGFFLRYTKANNYEGSLELQTHQGFIQILSSSIKNIDLADNTLV